MLAPDTKNYLLGRGRVYFDRFDSGGLSTGWLDLGNCPDFSVNVSKDTLPHYSSRSGIRTKDLEALRELASSFQFSCEEFSKENLALAVMGEITASNQNSGSASDESVTVKADRYVDLAYRKITSGTVVVTGSGGSPTYVEGTDYVIDYQEGMILAKSGGSIADGTTVLVDYDYGALTQSIIKALKDSKVVGALKFVGDPDQGPDIVIELWKSNLMPSGDIGLISEEYANFQLQAEVQKDETNHPTEPYFRVTHIEAASS
jgi:hypothetical protein